VEWIETHSKGVLMIIVHDRDGNRHEVDVDCKRSLMLQLRPLKVGVVGLCGGNAMCGTCHVSVRSDQLDLLEPPDEFEEELLETLAERQPCSRLACQLNYIPALDGLELTVLART
jgi:ferredoxin, 2Fe-2S